MIAVLIGFGYVFVVVLAISIAVSAADADRLAERVLGPGSSIDLELGLLAAMDESQAPAERRHQ